MEYAVAVKAWRGSKLKQYNGFTINSLKNDFIRMHC